MTKPPHTPLDDLFARLRLAESVEAARPIEQLIWEIWCHYDGANAHVNYLMDRAALAIEHRHLEAAELLCNAVVELAPEFAEGWNRRATIRYLMRNIDGSITDVDATLEREPRHFGALSGLGLCFIALGELEEAAVALRRTLKVHPHAAGARQNLADIEETLEQRQE